MAERERLIAALKQLASPLLAELRGSLQACGQVRLAVRFADGSAQERKRTFLFPTVEEGQVMLVLAQLLDKVRWQAGAKALEVALERIQDAVAEQLTLFPAEPALSGAEGTERERKLRQVQQYLVARFGASRLRRAVLAQPGAPLPEWRVGWIEEDGKWMMENGK